MSGERTRAVNALTALLRTVDLGIDARRALTTTTIATIAAWRTRSDNPTLAVCRAEAIRLARRISALDAELAANHTALHEAVTAQAPQLLALPSVGAVVAATVLLAWSHPGRVRSKAAFAALAGASPLPVSSGNTTRYRLNRGGDRRLNRALYTVAPVRMGHDPRAREGRTKTRDHTQPQALHQPATPPHSERRPPSHQHPLIEVEESQWRCTCFTILQHDARWLINTGSQQGEPWLYHFYRH
ncbi:transposase [Micromonospora humidisoli]|uniref:transposase n=1 Tax=Micromonospora sp. AKA109 TaxID=2733865 RepID=UPI002492D808|nr:transposase [Micromonospora sp. AKA109]